MSDLASKINKDCERTESGKKVKLGYISAL